MPRPTWDEYFLQLAHFVARRSTCLRRQVGAVLVKDKYIIATGYNGAPINMPHCQDIGCLRSALEIPPGERQELCRGVHAEINAVLQAALHGASTKNTTLYTISAPCISCAKILINAGVSRIVYSDDYPDTMGLNMLKEAGVKITKKQVQ